MKKQQRIYVVLLIFWMAVIYAYSARPADVSKKDSQLIGNLVVDVAQRWKQAEWSDKEELIFVENIDFYVRKAAHMTEYAVLGALIMGVLRSFGMKLPRIGWYALAAGTLYAASDELHQYFVPGRACQLRDVVIDGIGVALGVAAFLTTIFCKRH